MYKIFSYTREMVSNIISQSVVLVETPGLPSEKIVKDTFANLVLIINQLTKELDSKK